MSTDSTTIDALQRENGELRQRLEDAEGIVRAISKNEVDAFVVEREGEDHILVLDGVDQPYRLLIERMQQGAAVLGSDGSFIYCNRRLGDLLGVSPAELVGRPFSDHVGTSDREHLAGLLRRGAGGDAEHETTVVRRDGAALPVLLNVSPLVEIEGVVCVIITDLTQQKRHEQEREQFVQAHAARAAAEQVAAALRIADKRKDEFLATLGHELRNPLAPLRNGLQILNYHSSQDSSTQTVLDMMGRQLESLIRLVNDLLDVGRVTQGKISLQREPMDLRLAVARAVESCRILLDERRHRLELSVPDQPVVAQIDLVRITQVVTNLLNNAAKFTPDSGVIWLTLAADSGANQASIRVRDTGKGIAPDMLARVFDLFAQADSAVGRTESGLGIGLTLARRLVEMHGGTLEAMSPGLGQGSEFIVRLPLTAGSGESAAHGEGVAGLPAGARRIVVIDDEQDSAESLTRLLELYGHDVRLALNGQDAVAMLADYVPDLILLDIGMPGMNGYEVAKQLRSMPQLDGVRIVALSGYGGEAERRRSEAAGLDGHLIKPVDLAALQTLLASL